VLAVIAIVILLATAFSTQMRQWELNNPSYYLFYLGVALLAFGLRVKIPNRLSQRALEHTSMGFVFVIVALTGLSLRESLQIAGSTILILSIWRKRSETDIILADLLCTGTSTLAANLVYNAPFLTSHSVEQPVRLVLAACVCFAANQLHSRATLTNIGLKNKRITDFATLAYLAEGIEALLRSRTHDQFRLGSEGRAGTHELLQGGKFGFTNNAA